MSAEEDKDIVGTQFDPDAQREAEKKVKELKKANLRAVFGGGIGRISLIFVGIAFATLFSVGAFKLFGKKETAQTQKSASNAMIGAPSSQGADAFPATAQEAQMRRERNQEQAAAARSSGEAYIAPPVIKPPQDQANGQQQYGGMIAPKAPVTPEEQRVQLQDQAERDAGAGYGASRAQAQQRRELQLGELKQLQEQLKTDQIMPQILVASGKGWKGEPVATFSTSSFALPDRYKEIAAQQTQSGSASGGGAQESASSKTTLFSAGDACYGFPDMSINTDNPGNDVIATIPICKGMKDMRVIGKYEVKNQSQAVSFTFSKISIPGKGTFAVQAIGLNEQTFGTGIADEVDNHYFRKFGLTALASFVSGMGKAAQVVVGSTTTTTNGLASQTTTVQSPMSTSRQMKIAAGETAQQIGDELKAQNQNIQPTIIVYGPKDKNKNTGIGILFLSDVVIDEKK